MAASKVLVLNPEVPAFSPPTGLIVTAWDEQSYWIDKTFSFSEAFESTNFQQLSPLVMMDARLSFLLSLLDLTATTCLRGVPPLASLIFSLRSSAVVESDQNVASYWREYSQRPFPVCSVKNFSQALVLNQAEIPVNSSVVFLADFHAPPEIKTGYHKEREWLFENDSELGQLYILKLKAQP